MNNERIPVFSIKASVLSVDSVDGVDRQESMRDRGRPHNETESVDSVDSGEVIH